MAKFEIADKITVRIEGGYQQAKEDNGNWTGGKVNVGKLIGTNHGISAPMLGEYLTRPATLEEMLHLNTATAKLIRKRFFWDKICGDDILSQDIANKIYDTAINVGLSPAIKWAEIETGVSVDGKMDAILLQSLNTKFKN
jgi:lysozyme family protein